MRRRRSPLRLGGRGRGGNERDVREWGATAGMTRGRSTLLGGYGMRAELIGSDLDTQQSECKSLDKNSLMFCCPLLPMLGYIHWELILCLRI